MSYAHELAVKEYAVWGFVTPMTGREYEEAQKLRGETTYNITTRYFDNISSDMKILFRGRVLEIISVLNIDERNTELKIVAKEVDGSAFLTKSKACTGVPSGNLSGA